MVIRLVFLSQELMITREETRHLKLIPCFSFHLTEHYSKHLGYLYIVTPYFECIIPLKMYVYY